MGERADGPWLMVGLGNPGAEYETTRHNVGFMVADVLADRVGGTFSRAKAGTALVAQGFVGPPGKPVGKMIVAKPTSFMNRSGGPVKALSQYFDIPLDRIVVIHDELDIPRDTVRLKVGGGEGGHNGLRDITKALGTKDYARVRVGIDRPPGRMAAADYVLKSFSRAECETLGVTVEEAADAAVMVMTHGMTASQQYFHSK